MAEGKATPDVMDEIARRTVNKARHRRSSQGTFDFPPVRKVCTAALIGGGMG